MTWRTSRDTRRNRAHQRRVLQLLTTIERNQQTIMANTEALTTAVQANTEETAKAVAVIATVGPDPQPAIDAATTAIEANTASLAASVPAPTA